MIKTGARSGFDPARFKLDSEEEVQIGAFARRQRRRRLLVGALGVALIAAALGVYIGLRPHQRPERPERYPVVLKCEACGQVVETTAAFGQRFPVKCGKCGETACRPLWICRDCGARFVPEQTGAPVRCPKCGSLAVGSAARP